MSRCGRWKDGSRAWKTADACLVLSWRVPDNDVKSREGPRHHGREQPFEWASQGAPSRLSCRSWIPPEPGSGQHRSAAKNNYPCAVIAGDSSLACARIPYVNRQPILETFCGGGVALQRFFLPRNSEVTCALSRGEAWDQPASTLAATSWVAFDEVRNREVSDTGLTRVLRP